MTKKMRVYFLGSLAVVILMVAVPAMAQSELRKVEIGGVMSYLNMSDFSGYPNQPAYGGRLTINLNRNVALDSELNYLPIFSFSGGYRAKNGVQGLAGIKAGYRGKWLGVYGKVRPGAIYFRGLTEREVCATVLPGSNACIPRNTTKAALDYGGVIEIYLGERLMNRFDLGNTVIRFGNVNAGIPNFNRKGFQWSYGVGYRF